MKQVAMSQQKTIEDRALEKRDLWSFIEGDRKFPPAIVSTYTSQCRENERKPYFHVRLVTYECKMEDMKPRFIFKLRICSPTSLLTESWTNFLIEDDYSGKDALFKIFQRIRIMREIMTEKSRENFSEKHIEECASNLFFRSWEP